jgi:signal peptidase I
MQPTLQPGDWLVFRELNLNLSKALTANPLRQEHNPAAISLLNRELLAWSKKLAGKILLLTAPNGELIVKRVLTADIHGLVVLGDNQASSTDSRQFGTLPWSSVKGQYLFRYWPLVRR